MNTKYGYSNRAQSEDMKDFRPVWWRCWWIHTYPHVYGQPYIIQYRRSFRGGGLYIVCNHVESEPLAGPFESLRLAFVALELLS